MTDLNSPAALADLSAELDDDDNDPAGDDAGADPPDQSIYYTGTVTTGPAPYPGCTLVSRYPAGVLLLDRPGDRAWLLDYHPPTDTGAGTYVCRGDIAGTTVDGPGRWQAADSDSWDVRAYDPEFDGDEVPGSCSEPGCDDDAGGDVA